MKGVDFSKNLTQDSNIIPTALLLTILVGSVFFLYSRLTQSNTIISPLADEVDISKQNNNNPTTTSSTPSEEKLLKEIKSLLDTQSGIYSVYVYDLNRDKGFGFNETTIFTAASVNKLPILASLYFEAQRGKIDLDRRITIQTKDIQDYGTGVIRYQGPGTIYSVKSLAQVLIEKSDNTAAYVLTTLIGESRIQELVDDWGLEQTDIANNKSSNKDLSLLLTKMYRGQITDKAFTTEMIGFLDDSDFENRLPVLLPKDVKVYHKIGNEVGNIHDVGIIVHPKRTYYIGVLSNDVIDDAATEKMIAQISKLVFDFMTGDKVRD